MTVLPFPLSRSYANMLEQNLSIEELQSLVIKISDDLEKNPKDKVDLMMELIECYMRLDDIEKAELKLDECYNLVNGNVPFYLEMVKAEIKNRKGNTKEAVKILRQLLKDNKLIEHERISALVALAIYNSNLSNYEEIHKVVLELWNMVYHNSEIDFNDNSFYEKVSKRDAEPLIRAMNILESYLNGKKLLKDKTYSDIYEYIKDYAKDNQIIDDIIPYEEVDIEFPDIKYFSLKIISKPMSIEEEFNLEIYIYKLIISKYPGVLVLVNVIGNRYVSN
ncbi:MAG: hypothetical protein HQK96_08935 [Nitrospirae bacterium]|nr:hypothetical protein [Nitrospirota bacterium]